MFYLVEEFFSLQGEGRYAGVPSYFLRIGGCNLGCPGFGAKYQIDGKVKVGCDTYFAVDRSFSQDWREIADGTTMILHLEKEFASIGYRPHIVVTGGEPLIYCKDEVFYKVIEWLTGEGFVVTFETNGSIEIDFERFPAYKNIVFALSIKLSNSGEPKTRRINKRALEAIKTNSRESFLKFTIDTNLVETTAYDEIREIIGFFGTSEVYCMPVGESQKSIAKNDKAVFEFCMRHNFRYSDRLHIRVFDTTQGV